MVWCGVAVVLVLTPPSKEESVVESNEAYDAYRANAGEWVLLLPLQLLLLLL